MSDVYRQWCTGGVYGRGMVPGVGGGGVYRVPTDAARGADLTAKRAPEAPTRGLEWVVRWAGVLGTVMTTLRARSGPRTLPVITSRKRPSEPIGRDFINNILKLVKTGKCHQNVSIRPVIVPISKTGSKSQLLEFPDFHFR